MLRGSDKAGNTRIHFRAFQSRDWYFLDWWSLWRDEYLYLVWRNKSLICPWESQNITVFDHANNVELVFSPHSDFYVSNQCGLVARIRFCGNFRHQVICEGETWILSFLADPIMWFNILRNWLEWWIETCRDSNLFLFFSQSSMVSTTTSHVVRICRNIHIIQYILITTGLFSLAQIGSIAIFDIIIRLVCIHNCCTNAVMHTFCLFLCPHTGGSSHPLWPPPALPASLPSSFTCRACWPA